MPWADSSGRLRETVEVWRWDEAPECDHEIAAGTARVLSSTDVAIEIEAECAKCGGEIYGAPDVHTLSVHEVSD